MCAIFQKYRSAVFSLVLDFIKKFFFCSFFFLKNSVLLSTFKKSKRDRI